MGAGGVIIGAIAVIIAVVYQFALKDYLFILGFTRETRSIDDFPNYECRRVYHELLEGCEDLWLDEKDRKLYAACSDMDGRKAWTPAVNAFNTSARTRTDHVTVLNIDEPGVDSLFGAQALEISGGYKGAIGEKEIDLHGFKVEIIGDSRLRFWMINHRPPFNYTSGLGMDATKYGANSTIEVFEHTIGSSDLEFVRTIFDPIFDTPNSLALTGDGGVLVTNDHSAKTGFRRELDVLIGGGSLAYHSPTGKSQLMTPQLDPSATFSIGKFYFPNGLTRGEDGLFYMSDSGSGKIHVYSLFPSPAGSGSSIPILQQIDIIDMKIPIDNLSADSEGTIWAAGFPNVLKLMEDSRSPPRTVDIPATVLSIKKVGEGKGNKGWKGGYLAETVLEDGSAKVLAGLTVAVHDVTSERIFVSGLMADYLGVCEKRS